LAAGKLVESKTLDVPASSRATVEFRSLAVPHGFTRCEVRIDSADGLEADNRFRFAVERTDPWAVLFVHELGDARSPLYFRTALESVPNSRFRFEATETPTVANIDPARYPLIVLSDAGSLPAKFEEKLVAHVRNGGAVLVAAGPATARRLRVPVWGGKSPSRATRRGPGRGSRRRALSTQPRRAP
jgi:hypothetical protein